jgi:hypothetical protein
MQAETIFPENVAGTKVAETLTKFQTINPIREFQQFIEKSDWDECLRGYEKYMNRFSYGVIIASSIFFIPVCISIFSR